MMFRQFLLVSLFASASVVEAVGAGAASQVPPSSPIQQLAEQVQVTTTKISPVKNISKKAAVAAGMALAFNSGFSNGVCLSGAVVGGQTKQAVAAVTGAWTTSAVGMASGNTKAALTQLKALACYAGGSMIAGAMIPTPKAFQIAEKTGATFLVGAALFYLASRAAESSPGAMTCFYLALLANGLQNSVTSVHTGNLCRTAHFSGITSDMGTFAGQALRGNMENLFKLKSFALLALSFWAGGFASVFVAKGMSGQTLLLCALAHFLVGMHLVITK